MHCRKVNENEWEEISSWFKEEQKDFDVNCLPKDTSYVVEDKNKLAAFGSLVTTNANFCFHEFFITNKNLLKVTQAKAIICLSKYLENLSQSLNYECILGFVPVDNLSLVNHYIRRGAKLGSKLNWITYKKNERLNYGN